MALNNENFKTQLFSANIKSPLIDAFKREPKPYKNLKKEKD